MLHLSDLPCVSYSELFKWLIELALLPMHGALDLFSLQADTPHTHVLLPK